MTKQVALADRTYARLKKNRQPNESFSAAIERLLDESAKDPLAFLASPKSRIDPEKRLKQIEEDRDDATVWA